MWDLTLFLYIAKSKQNTSNLQSARIHYRYVMKKIRVVRVHSYSAFSICIQFLLQFNKQDAF